ncbi:unnamed protein product [Meloidogyne enterolobii]|uniref:Uncharacterized protein n=1 Tax=Meloidogyne enterolobii TaxID=390850 RepID=A0ACB0Z5T0_MELEN
MALLLAFLLFLSILLLTFSILVDPNLIFLPKFYVIIICMVVALDLVTQEGRMLMHNVLILFFLSLVLFLPIFSI